MAVVPLAWHQEMAAVLVAVLIRILALTLRIEIEASTRKIALDSQPFIWCFWHNRALLVPLIYRRLRPSTPGVVFTSASRDGSILARVVRSFRFESVRGSSSRRGVAALRGLVGFLKKGYDAGVTPDGPRGPRYQLQAGAVIASALSGVPLLPLHIRYERVWRLRSWDRFCIPKPGSRVWVSVGQPVRLDQRNEEALEQARALLEERMLEGVEKDS